MKIYQQLIRIDTVEEDGKFKTQIRVDEAQLQRLSFSELYYLVNQVEQIAHHIYSRRTELQKEGYVIT